MSKSSQNLHRPAKPNTCTMWGLIWPPPRGAGWVAGGGTLKFLKFRPAPQILKIKKQKKGQKNQSDARTKSCSRLMLNQAGLTSKIIMYKLIIYIFIYFGVWDQNLGKDLRRNLRSYTFFHFLLLSIRFISCCTCT